MKTSAPTIRQFTRIELASWRNFSNIAVDLQGRVFLVGPNASGKSNLLDVFRFLSDIVVRGGGFQWAVEQREGVSSLRCLVARRNPDIVVRVHLGSEEDRSGWVYEIQFSQDKNRRPILKKEKVVRQGATLLERPDENDRKDSERLTQTFLEQVNANLEFRDIATFFAAVRYRHLVPQFIREPDRSIGRRDDPFGGDFLEQIARTNEKTRRARLRRIQEALQAVVPQLEEIKICRDEAGIPHLRGRFEHWLADDTWQSERRFSDGTLRLIGLLWALLDGDGPLLLEEPELSLQGRILRYLPQVLARMQLRTTRQIMMSTHSSDLLLDEGIGLDEVLVLTPAPEGTAIHLASDFADVRALLEGGLPLAEAILPRTAPPNAHRVLSFGA